jgi:predicted aconitase with swiveling domain
MSHQTDPDGTLHVTDPDGDLLEVRGRDSTGASLLVMPETEGNPSTGYVVVEYADVPAVVKALTPDAEDATARVAAFLAAREPMTNLKTRFGAGLDTEVIASAASDPGEQDPQRDLLVSDLHALLAALGRSA